MYCCLVKEAVVIIKLSDETSFNQGRQSHTNILVNLIKHEILIISTGTVHRLILLFNLLSLKKSGL